MHLASGLTRSYGKRPDGSDYDALVEWQAQSYRACATSGTVVVVEMAEERKLLKYSCLALSYTVVPVAKKTMGVIGPGSLAFLKDL